MAKEKTAVIAALFVNGLIAVMKLVAAILSSSASMLAEFKHSIADWANGFFLLIGISQASKEADVRFHFGHGKKAFFWAFIASLGMLFIGGALSIQGGVHKILYPEPLEHVALNIVILILSIIFELYSMHKVIQAILLDAGEEYQGLSSFPKVFSFLSEASPSTKFIFFEDSAALLGLLIALIAIILANSAKNSIYDGIASIIIGVLLLFIGYSSAKENMNRILGEAAEPELMLKVGNYTRKLPGVKDVNEIKSMIIGPDKYLFYIVIEANPEIKLKDIDDLENFVKEELQSNFKELEHVHVNAIADNFISEWENQAENLQKLS